MNTLTERAKSAWKSKTVWFGLGVALLGYAQSARPDIDAAITAAGLDWIRPFVWPAVGIGVVVLRFITTQPLEEK